MAIFKNNLDYYISIVQSDEILESHKESLKRHNKEMLWRLSLSTGAIAVTTSVTLHYDKPEGIILTFASIALVNSLFNFYTSYKVNKLRYNFDIESFDIINPTEYRKMLRSNREKDRYLGKLKYVNARKFYRKNAKDIEKQFGFDSDNNLPINFLEKEKVPNQILEEYDMFNKKYELPELKISEEEITIFVLELEKCLKTKLLSHRIYYYTSNYFKILLAKGLINYWDEITIKSLTEYLKYIAPEEFTEDEIQVFKHRLINVFEEYKNTYKLTK